MRGLPKLQHLGSGGAGAGASGSSSASQLPSGIVYTYTQKDAEDVSKGLSCRHAIPSVHCHAGMSPEDRQQAQALWSSGQVPVICCTVAFGMGINKLDTRFVVRAPHCSEVH